MAYVSLFQALRYGDRACEYYKIFSIINMYFVDTR